MPNLIANFAQEPKAALEHFRKKNLLQSFNYDEIARQAHHKVFTVAKVMRQDLLADIKDSLETALKEGTGFDKWKKDITPTLQKYGWIGKQTITDPRTGEVKDIFVGSRRLHTIFDTNMRVSYAVQREASVPNYIEYRRYVSMKLPKSRATHEACHNIILRADNIWWKTNRPPNDWGCRCKCMPIGAVEMKVRGLKESPTPPDIASPDWAYDPADPNQGWDNTACAPIKEQMGYKNYNRPDLQQVAEGRNPAPEILPESKNIEESEKLIKQVLLGEQSEKKVQTPTGEVLINEKLLKHISEKRDAARERYANFILPTLEKPYEIWFTKYTNGSYRQTFIGLFKDATGKNSAVSAITIMRDGSLLYNVFKSKEKSLNSVRKGWLIYPTTNVTQ